MSQYSAIICLNPSSFESIILSKSILNYFAVITCLGIISHHFRKISVGYSFTVLSEKKVENIKLKQRQA